MQLVGIETIYAKVNPAAVDRSKPAIGHRIYPYLLRGLRIDRVHQVWATAAADRRHHVCAHANGLYVSDGDHRSA